MNNKWIRGALPALLIHISIGSVYAWSLFVKVISEEINKTQSQVQFAFSLAIFFLGMSAAFGGKIVEKNIHKSSLISCICFVSGLLVTALAVQIKSLPLIYLGYGCLMGIGLGTGYITPIKSLMLWFKDQKGLATGIAVCAFGFASAVASPIITFLLGHMSVRNTFIILAAIYVVPMLIAHFIIKKPNWYKESETDNGFKLMSMWKKPKFCMIWFIIFINISCGLALISVASPIMADKNVKPSIIALVVSIMGILNGTGRLFFSAISDKLKKRVDIYLVILTLSYVVMILAMVIKSNFMTYTALIVISACYGAGFSCLPSLLSDIFGMDNISKIHGLSLTAWAMAGLVGNQISNFVYKINNSYQPVFVVLMILYAIAFGVAIALRKSKLEV